MAERDIEDVSARMEKYENNIHIQYFDYLFAQIKNFSNLINLARILNNTAMEIAVRELNFENIFYNKNIIPLEETNPDFDIYSFNYNLLKTFYPLEIEFYHLKKQAESLLEFSEKFGGKSKFLSELLGYGEKSNFLILFQDNEIIKPTGGYFQAYGILEINNGQVKKFSTHSMLDLDNLSAIALTEIPPKPMIEYANATTWLPSDSNWDPSWPKSAQKFKWFFENSSSTNKNYNKNLDGVIAFNLNMLRDLLKETGEVSVYGEKINYENFRDILKDENKKNISELIIKVYKNLTEQGTQNLRDIFYKNIELKNILFYFNNQAVENIAKVLNYDGEIRNSDGDYLMVVDSSLDKNKNFTTKEEIYYDLKEENNEFFVNLKINYVNLSPEDYNSYVRIYVPVGSEFKSCNIEGKIDIYTESEKTVFGFFLPIEKNEIKNLICSYVLPEKIKTLKNKGDYSLYIQKQPGKKIDKLTVDLSFLDSIKLYEPTGFFVDFDNNHIKWEKTLKTDSEFLINF
ncbi:hypothetical protein A2331_01505 [Candidatus Falkowbacteria bacterium RIFOXYB2_FULL_34_18]|uniref:DUF4012 domain-containing protein n=1 Tax=Candidatus Falkowbacteria bacterium RIFOXYD2_FULL_34_120 TaxID=1798007 RepID=A0A1F5TPT9_9BACT|nr:MAG: hypothetical protein A2331_01505 [Candidatus Falkowbacteria bacterium RIFOXYB2_FULL_34_18]OGF29292.1 MAG: hypothetical protein A2500_05385 [Candidatus Falkowbacteria bacterium RIFOXYC12_FULL_34_55]OGF36408.1 MAG: hypothetical protein A2466_01045 [Candidatus Falkowbacteria bacterium RIFOXYC2_FULL_34_220]OGF38887.1 MAG: hypothetical protein A2515_05805 [Candidatus Falkowbacteria bacterium RIFOXYD12_FULL_34_57]OGF40906.1 MAG: hypothetical protein A2531_04030 [Candidatus Falkowbacteria bact